MNKSCSIVHCSGNDVLICVCSNSHFMHLDCIKNWMKASKWPSCPICKDNSLSKLKQIFVDELYERLEVTGHRSDSDSDDDTDDDDDDDDNNNRSVLSLATNNNVYTDLIGKLCERNPLKDIHLIVNSGEPTDIHFYF